MTRCFDFAPFAKDCPLTQDLVIEKLVQKHFCDFTGKRRDTAKQNLATIINATFELANSMGFAKMSMRDLHKASNISLGGLYNYFENKEALALMLTDALNQIAFDWLPELIDESMPTAEKLERLIRGHIYLSELLRPWFYFVFMESKNLPQKNKAKARETELNFQSLLETILSGNTLAASHLMALMQDWHVKHWKYREYAIDEFADSVNEIAQFLAKS